jgi:hypothetical protein
MTDSPPTRCAFRAHAERPFPAAAFRRYGGGWEHIDQDPRHLASGRIIVRRPAAAKPAAPRKRVRVRIPSRKK